MRVLFLCLPLLARADIADPCAYVRGKWTPNDLVLNTADDGMSSLSEAEISHSVAGISSQDLLCLGIQPKDPSSSRRFQGDLIGLDLKSLEDLVERSYRLQKSASSFEHLRWPDGVVPFVLSNKYQSLGRSVIGEAMKDFERETCIRFVPFDPSIHRHHIRVIPEDGCFSYVGRQLSMSLEGQTMSLEAGCLSKGVVIHELLHVLGFFHEHTRPDRDDWVEIVFENVVDEGENMDQFAKLQPKQIADLGIGYDYDSVLHYGPYAFSKNNQKTIVPLNEGGDEIGQRDGFSQSDIDRVNRLYNCPAPIESPAAASVLFSKSETPKKRKPVKKVEEIEIQEVPETLQLRRCIRGDSRICRMRPARWCPSDQLSLRFASLCPHKCGLCL